jgi:hypothetical protein
MIFSKKSAWFSIGLSINADIAKNHGGLVKKDRKSSN